MENLVSEHLDISVSTSHTADSGTEESSGTKASAPLFRFDATSCMAGASLATPSSQVFFVKNGAENSVVCLHL